MDSLDKRRVAVAGTALAIAGMVMFADPIADVRVTHDAAPSTISKLEAKIDLGIFAFSFLRSWRRVLR